MAREILLLGWLAALFFGVACAAEPAPARTPSPAPARPGENPATFVSATHTASLTPIAAPSATPEPPTPPPPPPAVCSPLAGIRLEDLADHLANPFQPPPPGSDDPHQGIDLAVFLPGSRIALPGNPVQAVSAARLSLVLVDRFPYGNALLLEAPLEGLGVDVPAPILGTPVSPTLTCPGETAFEWVSERRSLYILYAHLERLGSIQPGERVACGQELGVIGSSGNALNPHLHLEMRIGPAGASFPGMAHYTGSASPAEMDAYCLWRVSGIFELVDPGLFLGIGE